MRTLKPQILKEGGSRHCTILLLNGSGLWQSFSHNLLLWEAAYVTFTFWECLEGGVLGVGMVGHQGYAANWPGTVRVVSRGNLHLQKKPVFQDSMALKKGIGYKGAGRTGLSRWLMADSFCCSLGGHEASLLSPNYGMGRCQLSFIYSGWCKFSQIMEYNLQEKNNFPGTINLNKDTFFFLEAYIIYFLLNYRHGCRTDSFWQK